MTKKIKQKQKCAHKGSDENRCKYRKIRGKKVRTDMHKEKGKKNVPKM